MADLETGVPFIATKGGRVVAVNIFLETDYWFEDVPQIIRNAALWTAGGRAAICWASACPDYGAVVPGGTVQLEVTFDAGAQCVMGGEHSDTLIVASNDPSQPEVRIALQLTVTPLPDIAVSHDELNYGSVYVGSVAPDTLVVTNEGAENLTVSGILVTGEGFEADPGGFVLAPFESRELEVRFAPSAAGPVEGSLTISSDDPDEPQVGVLLSGTGVILPEIAVFPDAIDDTLFTGDVSTHTLTIENNGNGDLFFEVFESEAGLSILNVQANPGASGVGLDRRTDSRSRGGAAAGVAKVARRNEELRRMASLIEQVGSGPPVIGAGVHASPSGAGVSRRDPGVAQMVDVPTGEPRRVLIVDSGIDMSDMRDLLLAFDEIDVVDLYHGELIPPTLETLRGYHCVIVTVNRPFNDPFAIGDVLADYVDSGGAVILTEGSFMMVFGVDYSIKGRFMDDGYCPFYVGNWFFGTGGLGDYDENHPIMKGAESAFAALITSTTLTPGAQWVADWNVGQPFIATKGAASVAMNVFLDTTVPSWTGDIPVMLRNAILWSTGERVCWVSPTPTFGTVPPHSAVDVSIMLEADAECAAAGDFSDILVVRSNDPDEPRIAIPVNLRVVPRQIIPLSTDWNLVSWNLDTDVDSTTQVLSGVMDDLVVALGFDGAGLTFDPEIPPQFNTLQTMDHMHGYWLRMVQANNLEIVGDPVAHQTPIPLSSGWNLVSYLPDVPDSTAHAIGSVLPYTTVVLGYDNGGLMFDPSIPPEFNTLQLMSPGFGYWIKTTAECELIYPSSPIHPLGPVLAASARGRTPLEPAETSQVTPTREWIGIWGDGVRLNGGLIPVGTVVHAVDNNDVVCGAFTVKAEGKFGLMAVYR
ncbi:MAG: choice-of-anchor D domain-containing protein, partial [bacterium]